MRQLRTPNAPPHTLPRPVLLHPLQSRSTPGKHHPTPNAHPKPLDQPRPRQAPHQPAHRPTRIIHQPRHMEQLHTGTLHTTPTRLRPRRRNRLHRPRPLHPRRTIVNFYPHNWIEISPSGHGLHIWGYATPQPGFKREWHGQMVEFYSQGRYITITGRTYQHGTLEKL